MKKIVLLFLSLLLMSSCVNKEEDKKINLEFLSWSYNKITHELNLSNQDLTQVPNFEKYLTWSYISDVWSIDLSNNSINEIDSEVFKYFPNLKELNLSYNEIEYIKLKHNFIQDLKLHKNNLTKVDLDSLVKLNTINLWYNELLSWKDISLPKSIVSLELQHNKLDNINGINKFTNLETLKLEFNSLEDNDLEKLSWLKNLNYISLWFNKLTKEREKSFNDFNKNNKKEKAE